MPPSLPIAGTVRGLRYALVDWTGVTEADLEDFAHDALLKIIAALDTFRGESHFTTWAHKIAVRVALTELRRRWRDVSLGEMTGFPDDDFIPDALIDQSARPEQRVIQRTVLNTLRRVIAEELTERLM